MERDGLQEFMRQSSHRILTQAEERALAERKDAGDKDAYEQLVLHNVRLVYSLARRWGNSGVPLDDLIQYGMLGLIRAVEKFDWRKGFKLSTYATWWIRQAIDRGVTNSERAVRLPTHVDQLVRKLVRAERKLAESGKEMSEADLATRLGVTVEKLAELRRVSQTVLALDGFTNDDGELVDVGWAATDDTAVDVEEQMLGDAASVDLRRALGRLNERERRVIEMRFGLDGGEELTLQEVGAVLGVTRERVRQIETRALQALRTWVRAA